MNLLAEKLRLLRLERGLTLRQAEELTGVTKGTLSDLERGRREPFPPTLYKIAQGYGIPPRELLERTPLEEVSSPPKASTPPSVSRGGHPEEEATEERRERLRLEYEMVTGAYALLEKLVQQYGTLHDGLRSNPEDLLNLLSVILLTHSGAENAARRKAGTAEDEDAAALYRAVAQFEDLVNDFIEAVQANREEAGGLVVDLREYLRSHRMAAEGA